jgi:hypothetical protein
MVDGSPDCEDSVEFLCQLGYISRDSLSSIKLLDIASKSGNKSGKRKRELSSSGLRNKGSKISRKN